MKPWAAGVIGSGLFAAAMLMTVPASVARYYLPAGLEVNRFEGTLWKGQAVNVRWQGQPVFDQVGWNWRLSRLLLFTFALDLNTVWQNTGGQAQLRAGFSSYRLQDTDLTLPIDPFTASIPQLQQYRLRGNLNLVTKDFLWAEGRGAGELTADWRQARSEWTGESVMGDYRVRLRAAEKGYAVKVETLNGPLMLSGDGTGEPGQGWNVGATIQAPANQLAQFENLLSKISPAPDGKYFIRYSFK